MFYLRREHLGSAELVPKLRLFEALRLQGHPVRKRRRKVESCSIASVERILKGFLGSLINLHDACLLLGTARRNIRPSGNQSSVTELFGVLCGKIRGRAPSSKPKYGLSCRLFYSASFLCWSHSNFLAVQRINCLSVRLF